jgi:hypothetical protein
MAGCQALRCVMLVLALAVLSAPGGVAAAAAAASTGAVTGPSPPPRDAPTRRDFGSARLRHDPEFGVPLILGGSFEEVWRAVGYTHASARLYQIFLRLVTANGRLAEFYGPGNNRANVNADVSARQQMYTEAELALQVAEQLSTRARVMHEMFALGMRERVQEVNDDPDALMPFEFAASTSLDTIPLDVFELSSVMQYTLYTMRRLCSGYNPVYQLQNAELLAVLQERLGDEGSGWDAFNDVATELGSFPLLDTVLGDDAANGSSGGGGGGRAGTPGGPRATPPPRLSAAQRLAAQRVIDRHEQVEHQLYHPHPWLR